MFKLKGYIQFSNPMAIENLGHHISYVNERILKGGGDNPSQITEFSVDGDKLRLTVEGEYPKPHEVLLRFRKYFKDNVAKEYRIGIRDTVAEEYIAIFESEHEPKKSVNITYAETVEFVGKKCTLKLKGITEKFLENNYIDRIVKLVREKVKNQYYEGKEFRETVLEAKKKDIVYTGDPSIDLEKKRWIKRSGAKGQWVYGREYTALLNVIKELMHKNIFEPSEFSEMVFPKFESWEIPMKSGHASSVYPNAYFVMVPRKSTPEEWEDVVDHFKIEREIDKEGIMKRVDSVGIMSYAQCPPFWPYLEKSTIDNTSLPLKVYDWSGPTYRNESGGTHGLDRLEEFHRVETLWVGTKEQTVEIWKNLANTFARYLNDVLDLEVRMVNVTPWWMVHDGIRAEKGTGEIGTFDFEAYIPYRGDRSSEWLEIQNVSSNGDKYPKAFGVKIRKGELWSGCAGGSLERISVAFLAQKGIEPKNWPSKIRELYESKAKNVKELKIL